MASPRKPKATAPPKPKPATLVTMTPRALKVHAGQWFLAGFAVSGVGFNGEKVDLTKHEHARSLLLAEFERCWARRK